MSKVLQVRVRDSEARVGGAVGGMGATGVSAARGDSEGRRHGGQHRARRRRGQGVQRRQKQCRTKQRGRLQVAGGDRTVEGRRRDEVEGGGGAAQSVMGMEDVVWEGFVARSLARAGQYRGVPPE